MSKLINPQSFCLGAVSALLAVAVAIYLAPLGGAPDLLTYELAHYDAAGDRYVDDYGLSLHDCLIAMHGHGATGCEVER